MKKVFESNRNCIFCHGICVLFFAKAEPDIERIIADMTPDEKSGAGIRAMEYDLATIRPIEDGRAASCHG